jgi:hypothetical protein
MKTKRKHETGEHSVASHCSAYPISAAPKDGTFLLVWTGQWELGFWDQGEWYGAHHSSTHGNRLYNPTHWMPQPPAPSKELTD